MKKQILSIFTILLIMLLIVGCANKSLKSGDSGMSPFEPGSKHTNINDGINNDKLPQAGQLTSSALFDNDHYDYWKKLISSTDNEKGIYDNYESRFSFNTKNRIKITLKNASGVEVTIDEQTARTDVNGVAYIYPTVTKEEYDLKIKYVNINNETIELSKQINGDFEMSIDDAKPRKNIIELMLIIDTTGSMGDELEYLKSELAYVIEEIKKNNNDISIYIALLFYRDQNDAYITKYVEFTDDVNLTIAELKKQGANGGGDFEEAVQIAFNEALQKNWTSKNSTKIILHVADAPAHDQDIQQWNECVLKASSMGIQIITIASSGIDRKTEYFFRAQSMITNGVYTYLTNHSGIGYDHLTPIREDEEIVEYLNLMLIRLINGIHTGKFETPIPWNNANEGK
ncbi:MAG: vWA domain-containing protein [Bacilli bacterium]|nr:vWA domain-containing protein [Bacilli bacterium]